MMQGFKLILTNLLISHYTGIYAKSKVSHFYDFFFNKKINVDAFYSIKKTLIESIFVLQKKMSQIIFMSIKHFTISLMMVQKCCHMKGAKLFMPFDNIVVCVLQTGLKDKETKSLNIFEITPK